MRRHSTRSRRRGGASQLSTTERPIAHREPMKTGGNTRLDSLGRPHRNRLRCPFLAAGSKGKYQKAIAGSRLGKTLLKVRRSDCPDLSRCRSNSGMGRGVYRDLCFTRPRLHVSIYTSIWLGYPNHPYCPVGIAQGETPAPYPRYNRDDSGTNSPTILCADLHHPIPGLKRPGS